MQRLCQPANLLCQRACKGCAKGNARCEPKANKVCAEGQRFNGHGPLICSTGQNGADAGTNKLPPARHQCRPTRHQCRTHASGVSAHCCSMYPSGHGPILQRVRQQLPQQPMKCCSAHMGSRSYYAGAPTCLEMVSTLPEHSQPMCLHSSAVLPHTEKGQLAPAATISRPDSVTTSLDRS